ncbi:hypothetical protein MNBD_PLANCTO03-396, partial [hydrothermal vent metagenome]
MESVLGINQIDDLMERACLHIAAAEYFEAERLSVRSLRAARANLDFERMARIVLPLQEARRQLREAAWDVGVVALVRSRQDIPKPLVSGCYLLMPPMIGRDGTNLRETLSRRHTPASVLTREPLTRTG